MTKAAFITDTEFDKLLVGELPLVVDFTATWCGPCRKIAPYIDQLAEEYQGRATVVKVDLDKYKDKDPEIYKDKSNDKAKKFGLKSIPAVLFFKGGELVDKLVGVAPYEEFSKKLDSHLEN